MVCQTTVYTVSVVAHALYDAVEHVAVHVIRWKTGEHECHDFTNGSLTQTTYSAHRLQQSISSRTGHMHSLSPEQVEPP